MVPVEHRDLRVALIAHREARTQPLRQVLGENGIDVALSRGIDAYEPHEILAASPDVLLVDLDGMGSRQLHRLEELIDLSEVPILFTEGGTPGEPGWGMQIAYKLAKLADARVGRQNDHGTQAAGQASTVMVSVNFSSTDSPDTGDRISHDRASVTGNMDGQRPDFPGIWVIGASLGGPQALTAFLSALPADIPASFVVAQHIGESFLHLFAEQLDRVTALPVGLAQDAQKIRPGEVVLAPVTRRFTVDDGGIIRLTDDDIPGMYRPCVNDVMQQVAGSFGPDAGGIVFSGMGEDGAKGCRYIAERGGTVWAQLADSCVISSMPDAARCTGTVSLNATPEQLAACLDQAIRKTSLRNRG